MENDLYPISRRAYELNIKRDRGRLTTGHIRASNAAKREGGFLHAIAHTDSSAITLVNTIDEEVSESRVSTSNLDSSSCVDEKFDV